MPASLFCCLVSNHGTLQMAARWHSEVVMYRTMLYLYLSCFVVFLGDKAASIRGPDASSGKIGVFNIYLYCVFTLLYPTPTPGNTNS